MHRAIYAALLLVPTVWLSAWDSPLAWANALRGTTAPALRPDPLLSQAAGAYAAELAATGVLSHTGPADGSRLLDRFFREGGTAFEVGEILGAGPDLAAVELAWEASPGHRRVVLGERYTIMGWGSASRGTQQVWVVMMARTVVEGLSLEEAAGVLVVAGKLGPSWAIEPWLDAGSGESSPSAWDSVTRRFEYRVPLVDSRVRILIGCRDAYGDRQATDSVTWPRGTESPAGAGRSTIPVPPP
ncbi:MAG: CAP domain-containing protein [Spirochaetes bacterium]|nr:CAP domain-containing protein [Spirochaetota bacterium]